MSSDKAIFASSVLAILSTLAGLDSVPSFVGQTVPKEEMLRIRVDQFYKAYVDQNWSLIVRLMTPEVQRCHDPEEIRKGWSEDGLVKVLAGTFRTLRRIPHTPTCGVRLTAPELVTGSRQAQRCASLNWTKRGKTSLSAGSSYTSGYLSTASG